MERLERLEWLECDRCKRVYADPESIEGAKQHQAEWEALVHKDGDEPRGISPCPIFPCSGELVLHSKE